MVPFNGAILWHVCNGFKAKMYQIRFPRHHCVGSLQRFLRPSARFKGPTYKGRDGKEREGMEGEEGVRRKRTGSRGLMVKGREEWEQKERERVGEEGNGKGREGQVKCLALHLCILLCYHCCEYLYCCVYLTAVECN